MQLIDADVNKAIEILDKMQFFGGQRAGRELWATKPKEVQNADLETFNRDVEFLRKVVLSKIENIAIDAEPMRHGYWQDGGCYIICSVCGADYDRYDDGGYLQDFAYCPACGAKMDAEESTNE